MISSSSKIPYGVVIRPVCRSRGPLSTLPTPSSVLKTPARTVCIINNNNSRNHYQQASSACRNSRNHLLLSFKSLRTAVPVAGQQQRQLFQAATTALHYIHSKPCYTNSRHHYIAASPAYTERTVSIFVTPGQNGRRITSNNSGSPQNCTTTGGTLLLAAAAATSNKNVSSPHSGISSLRLPLFSQSRRCLLTAAGVSERRMSGTVPTTAPRVVSHDNSPSSNNKKDEMPPGTQDSEECPVFTPVTSQPRHETGLDSFLCKYPNFDGRGTIIGIMDTGVDPAGHGLQVTTDGKPKMIEMFDCTGAGDVDTSTVVSVADGYITGLSGRKLKIPESWVNPSGKYHLGLINLFNLYSKGLRDRMKKIRKERLWDQQQREALVGAQREQLQYDGSIGEKPENLNQKFESDEMSTRVSLLKAYEKDYNDCGPTADCIVFNTGDAWKVCIDSSCRARLMKAPLLSPFSKTGDYAKLNEDDLMTVSVNVHNNGNLLEIVATAGSHGTHVASMAAGNFPEDPSRNGVAPGAQVVSFCIGDSRLGTMEQGAALTRALNLAAELGVDVLNYSYGEATHLPNVGFLTRALEECVWKRGVMFVSSAGNNGPALTTGGCPGSTSTAAFSVGAYLSPEMMIGLYSAREQMPAMLYPWSSRGPTTDGAMGVDVCAPGGAITTVPKWTLKGSQLMNGTSMSSPQTAGSVACLMSGLKQIGVEFNPFTLKLALNNSCTVPPGSDLFARGNGLINLPNAWKWLESYGPNQELGITHYTVKVGDNHRGIYMREHHQVTIPKEFLCTISPAFKEEYDNEKKVEFFKQIILQTPEPSVDWVQFPRSMELMNDNRAFSVRVDPTNLLPGSVNYTQIEVLDAKFPEAGMLCRVIIPEEITPKNGKYVREWENMKMSPSNDLKRFFVRIPLGASWAVLKFHSEDKDKYGRYVMHTVQLLPDNSYRTHENHKMLLLANNADTEQVFRVVGGRTLEVCVTKWWTSYGESHLSLALEFHGLAPSTPNLSLRASSMVHKFDVLCPLSFEEFSPNVTLKNLNRAVKPSESTIKPLGERDKFADEKQIYELRLTYNFNVPKSNLEVMPSFPSISPYLYENELDSQLWMIFDCNKKYISAGEAYPNRYWAKCDKGDHVVILQLRHQNEAFLERLKEMIGVISYKLEKTISLDVYNSYGGAISGLGSQKCSSSGVKMTAGQRKPVYIALPSEDKLPKPLTSGSWLSGFMTLTKDESAKKANQWPVQLTIPTSPSKDSKKSKSSSGKDGCKKQPQLHEMIRDTKIGWLNKVNHREGASVYQELLRDFPDHLPLLLSRLNKLQEKNKPEEKEEILWISDEICRLVNLDDLLRYYGTKEDLNFPEAQSNLKEEMEKNKSYLLEAYAAKGKLLSMVYMEKERPELARVISEAQQQHPTNNSNNNKKQAAAAAASSTTSVSSPASDDKKTGDGPSDENVGDISIKSETTQNSDNFQIIGDEKEKGAADSAAAAVQGPGRKPLPTTVTQEDIDEIYRNVLKLVDPTDSKVIVMSGTMSLTRAHYGRALKLFTKANEDKPSKYLETIMAQLCDRLGWTHVREYQKTQLLNSHPPSYRPF